MDLPLRCQPRSCKQYYKRLMKFRWSLRLSFFIWTLRLEFAGSLKHYSLRRNPKISNWSWSISTHTKRILLAYVLLYLRSCSKRVCALWLHVTVTVYDRLLQSLSINRGQTHRSVILPSAFKRRATPPGALSKWLLTQSYIDCSGIMEESYFNAPAFSLVSLLFFHRSLMIHHLSHTAFISAGCFC